MKIASILNDFNTNLNAEIPGFQFDNKMYRHKSLWAIGNAWHYKGNEYQVANYGDWKSGQKFTFRNFDPRQETKSFNKSFQEKMQEMQTIQKFEAEKKYKECREKWKPIFDTATAKSSPHDYLKSKNIDANYCAKIHPEHGSLLIPAYNSQYFVGVQMIFQDGDSFQKRFSSGIELTGSFSFIGDIKNENVVYVAEGFATAATIHEITGKPCLITFNCHNIYPAIQEFRLINKFSKLIICADNDQFRVNNTTGKKENIGIIKAKYASHRLSNCIVKIPKFDTPDPNCTDFNDLANMNRESAEDQLQFKPGDFVDVTPLGRQGKKFYYFSTETKQVQDLTADQHTKNYFLTMAEPQYWADLYGFKRDKDGNETNKPDWELVQEKLLAKQRSIGFFNPKNIRGYGCWWDDKRLVVNLGNNLLIDGEQSERIESKYLYESNDPLDIDMDNPLSIQECQKIINVFKKLNYKNPGDWVYLVAWIGQAQIFGALDWRFQLWITGEKGSGKTEILRMISSLVFRSEIYQSVTAASIRQHLKSNAMPMIIDEAEPNNPNEQNRMDGVIEVIRQCSSRLNTKSLRGTASGTALEYNVNSNFLLGSIQTYLPTMADVSRFFVVEMNSNENQNPEIWNGVQSDFHEIENYAPRIFPRMIKMAPVIRDSIRYAKKLLTDQLIKDKRGADQIATAMGVLSSFYSDSRISSDFIFKVAESLNLGSSEYEKSNLDDESENCADVLLNSIVDKKENLTLQSILSTYSHDDSHKKTLESYGVVVLDNKDLFIWHNAPELKKMMRSTMFNNLGGILKRHDLYIGDGRHRVFGKPKYGLFLKGEIYGKPTTRDE